ncbi:MAG: hypothetical protein R3F38_00500 [Gammaproteobacteria bacterium]
MWYSPNPLIVEEGKKRRLHYGFKKLPVKEGHDQYEVKVSVVPMRRAVKATGPCTAA